jgi:poly(A) polymerase
MIKKLIKRLLGQAEATEASSPPPLGRRVEVAVAEHGIDLGLLDDNAVRVVKTLKDAGHEAYVVGGAVRDLLVSRRPKDFDVATDATPEQVKSLFRRAFIIGRRFRIVHVVFGRGREHEVIEVSTFRALLEAADATAVAGNEKTSKAELAGKAHAVDAQGRVLRDNVWGPQIEDAARRDFSVNAMYYDPTTQVLVDYHGGLADVRAKRLRIIGDAATRYREDPVRILRAIRFAAKLGFQIEPRSAQPMGSMAELLHNVPVSRLFDEMVKLMQTGHALASLAQLRAHRLPAGIFPALDGLLQCKPEEEDVLVLKALADTDARVAEGRSVAPSFLLACLLWAEVRARWHAARAQGELPFPALQQAIDAVFDARIGDISGRGKLAADMREIWQMQPRFERRAGQTPYSLVEQARFRAGYDFLRLRAESGEVPTELADWWEDFHLGSDDERQALLADARKLQPAPRGKPARVPRTPAAASETAGPAPQDADSDAPAADPAPRKRRRRRRRGAAADAMAASEPGPAEGGGRGDSAQSRGDGTA